MNLNKSFEFFNPKQDESRIHIVGCGSVGSTLAEILARCSVTKMTLWDFDKVESHNIVNQMFTEDQIGENKAKATKEIICKINPEAEDDVVVKTKGWNGQVLSGYVFLAVDSIEIRKQIVDQHFGSVFVKAMFDVRTSLESAQHYAAKWDEESDKKNLRKSMNFTSEEAAEETPVSACGITLGVATTVRLVCSMAVNNYINFIKKGDLWKFVLIDGFNGTLVAV